MFIGYITAALMGAASAQADGEAVVRKTDLIIGPVAIMCAKTTTDGSNMGETCELELANNACVWTGGRQAVAYLAQNLYEAVTVTSGNFTRMVFVACR